MTIDQSIQLPLPGLLTKTTKSKPLTMCHIEHYLYMKCRHPEYHGRLSSQLKNNDKRREIGFVRYCSYALHAASYWKTKTEACWPTADMRVETVQMQGYCNVCVVQKKIQLPTLRGWVPSAVGFSRLSTIAEE